jgi:lipooligosaccharide transport system permease protein
MIGGRLERSALSGVLVREIVNFSSFWKSSAFSSTVQPTIYLLAFGFGFGSIVSTLVTAETLWIAARAGTFGSVPMVVGLVFGLDPSWGMLTVPFIGFIAGFGWGACGIMIAGIVKSIDGFSYVSSALLTPLFLVAGTFFPLTELPEWAQVLGNFNPLFHCVQLVRHAAFGWQWPADLGHLAVLLGFALVMWRLAIVFLERRLID